MIIDFHTHAFPDFLAPKAMSILTHIGDGKLEACHDGTISGLVKNMDDWGIDYSVLAPIVTKASQTISLNEWAANINNKRIIPLGSMFPHTEDYKKDIDYIADLGLHGIKLHTEYQNFHLLDSTMMKAYEYALKKGLLLLFHAGEDDGMPPPYKSSPEKFAKLADEFAGERIVIAHLGSYKQWDEVYDLLAGKDVYFDTAMGFCKFPVEKFEKIVRKHGAEKILFASDAPWSCANEELKALYETSLTLDEKALIAGKNAQKLLNINTL